MEILILFIIMMVISSILKSFRGTDSGRAYTPPAQRPQRREIPFPPELFGLPEEEREEEKEPPVELYFPERSGYWPEVEVPVKKAPVQVKEEPSLHEPSLHLEKKLPRKASPSSKSPRTRPGGPRPAREEERDMGRPLQELLNGEKLPLAIIAAEVFSRAPRQEAFQIEQGIQITLEFIYDRFYKTMLPFTGSFFLHNPVFEA